MSGERKKTKGGGNKHGRRPSQLQFFIDYSLQFYYAYIKKI
jgi:hypothetical protein